MSLSQIVGGVTQYFNWQKIHPRLHRHVKHRLQSIESGKGLDWATAEVREHLRECIIYF
jgi:2-oxoglutarate dehydrogenase complex dehydrogenase (E1) component-like enzyme